MTTARLAAAVALILSLAPGAAAAPRPGASPPIDPLTPPAPSVGAESWILYDDTHGLELASRDPDTPRPMASTTKIMTALVALEEGDPEQVVTVSEEAADVVGSTIGLVPGERLRLSDLIDVLLVRSANDAALAVAEGVAGSVDAFVAMMNARAEEMGLESTSFANPHGIDTPGHVSTARDLLTLAREAMKNPALAEAVALAEASLPDTPDGTERTAENTNLLLGWYPGMIGVKTGLTPRAGAVLVAAADRDGRRLYAVVMGSEGSFGHFADAATLLDHGFEELMPVAAVLGEVGLALGDSEDVVATAEADTTLHLAALGLVGEPGGDEPTTTDDDPPATAPSEPPLPGLREALGWVTRLWNADG